ncbi:MAG TPA: flagellar hook-basal body complex protein FliE [Acidimicrobiia bacterium]|nr:flagellar hook-basal body complex protein FliE [Acidimicrobiia bacterium]
MTVTPIGGVLNAAGLGSIVPVTPETTAAAETDSSTAGVGNAFTQALDSLQGTQSAADSLAQTAATGNLTDIHNYTIAATEASVTTELTVAVRDRAVEAFNDIMRMQV